MIIRTVFIGLLALLAVGCASVINGTTQEVGLRSLPPGATVSVSGQSATTPAKVKLARNQDHTATFTMDGFPEQQAHLKQKLDGAFYGNLLLGGIIGIPGRRTPSSTRPTPRATSCGSGCGTRGRGRMDRSRGGRGRRCCSGTWSSWSCGSRGGRLGGRRARSARVL